MEKRGVGLAHGGNARLPCGVCSVGVFSRIGDV